nr:hypothetical protein [Anaerolineae bacterium]
MDELHIGIWGPEKAGKTTYVLALKQYLRRVQSLAAHNPEDTQLSRDARWTLEATPDTQRDLREVEDKFLQGIFPPATDPGADPKIYAMTFKKAGRAHIPYHVSMLDAAGAHVMDDADRSGYLNMLSECTGLLLLLDPDADMSGTGQTYFAALDRLMGFVDEAYPIYLAFCLTKVDQDRFWPPPAGQEQIQALCWEEVQGFADFYELHKGRFNDHFFAVSAVGRVETPDGSARPNIVVEGEAARMADYGDAWRPYRLFDPLLWLFDRVDDHILPPPQRLIMKRHYKE